MNADTENLLRHHLQTILATHSTASLQLQLEKLAKDLHITPLTLAAALLYLDLPIIAACRAELPAVLASTLDASSHNDTRSQLAPEDTLKKQRAEQLAVALKIPEIYPEKHKMVRYRLEIGQSHQVTSEDIKTVLVNESGVDKNTIGYLDIRSHYTLIDLPPGMPPDIFQLLQTVEIKQQPLQIKRVNTSRKRGWQRRKSNPHQRTDKRATKPASDEK